MINKKIVIFTTCIICIFLCGGCFGIVVQGDKSAIVNNPNISKDKGYIGNFSLKPNTYVTEAELIKYWGSPDNVMYNDKGQKQLIYRRNELRWNGIFVLAVVVPIPLLIPVGHDYFLFTIENGNISSVYMKNDSDEFGSYCTIFPLFHAGPWCEVHTKTDAVDDVPLYEMSTSSNLIREESEFAPNTKDSCHGVTRFNQ